MSGAEMTSIDCGSNSSTRDQIITNDTNSPVSGGDTNSDPQIPVGINTDVETIQTSATENQSMQDASVESEIISEPCLSESFGEGHGEQEENLIPTAKSQSPDNEATLPANVSEAVQENSCSNDFVQTQTFSSNQTDAGKVTDVVNHFEPLSKESDDVSKDIPMSEGTTSEKTEISANGSTTSISLPLDDGSDSLSGINQDTVIASSPSSAATDLPSNTSLQQQSLYKIKTIKWKDTSVPIITQNENGPCPLIALINVLLLKAKINPFGNKVEITPDDLMSYLGDCILFNAPMNMSNDAQLDYEQNVQDAFSVFPKLQTGLDVNVKFTGVRDFEYTTECIIFDLLNIPLYHGWLVDPQAADVLAAVSKLSYNQLVEKIITNKSVSDSDMVTEALVAESFLERSASQLTYHGLYELNAVMKPDELAVLFRNNHFITIYKHNNELFQLVTDQGFLHENVIWETLSNIEGDGLFVDYNFVTVPPKPAPAVVVGPSSNMNEEEQIQQDYLVALSLQEEQKREEEKAMVWQEYKEKELGATDEMTDEELARRLQAEEQKQAELSRAENACGSQCSSNNSANRQPLPEDGAGRPSQKKRERDCRIL